MNKFLIGMNVFLVLILIVGFYISYDIKRVSEYYQHELDIWRSRYFELSKKI